MDDHLYFSACGVWAIEIDHEIDKANIIKLLAHMGLYALLIVLSKGVSFF